MKRLVLIMVLLAAASADEVTFTARGGWSGAAGSVTNTSFTSLVPAGGSGLISLGITPPPVGLGDVSYLATSVYVDGDGNVFPNGYVFLSDPSDLFFSPSGFTNFLSPTEYDFGADGKWSGGLLMTLSGNHSAIGFNLDTIGTAGTYLITLSNGATFTITANSDSSLFFGVTSDTQISSVYIQAISPAGLFGLSEVSYDPGGSAPVPEPTTLALMGTGLLAGWSRLRNRK